MKTISDYPLAIGRLLEADRMHRERLAARQALWHRWDVRLLVIGFLLIAAFVLGWRVTAFLSAV